MPEGISGCPYWAAGCPAFRRRSAFPVRLCLVRGQRHFTPGGGVPAGLARYGWYALAAALLSAAVYFAGLMCTHLAAFRVATNMRKASVAHLIDLPLGYFNANLTGRLRKQIDDNAALTETLLAHTIPDAVGGIVTPILAVVLLFVFDWRMGLACLIPMIIGLVCLMSMMTGTGMKFLRNTSGQESAFPLRPRSMSGASRW